MTMPLKHCLPTTDALHFVISCSTYCYGNDMRTLLVLRDPSSFHVAQTAKAMI